MSMLVIDSDDAIELKLLQYLAGKMGLTARLLSDDEREDIGLLKAMQEGAHDDLVSEEEIFDALKGE